MMQSKQPMECLVLDDNQIKLRKLFGDLMVYHMETSTKLANVLHTLLKDVPVDNSKVEYKWNIMGKADN